MDRQATFVVAVSGGIDSMVLLDMISHPDRAHNISLPKSARYVAAHVDHGIRQDSSSDAQFVASVAQSLGYTYESIELSLGEGTAEETARGHRLEWLTELREKYQAEALITAHHQDDVFETIMINLVRGTSWRGLSSLRQHDRVLRPLLGVSKAEIIRYAIDHHIEWREDETNQDVRYLRNYLRYLAVPRLLPEQRKKLWDLYKTQCRINHDTQDLIESVMQYAVLGREINRYFLSMIDRSVAHEILRQWCGYALTEDMANRLWLFVLTAQPGKRLLQNGDIFVATRKGVIVSSSDI